MDLTIKGETPEDREKHAATIIERLNRRIPKTVTVLMPACPIAAQIEDVKEGAIFFSFLAPIGGLVKTLAMKITHPTFKRARLELEAGKADNYIVQSFSVKLGLNVFTANVDMLQGDTITFLLKGIEPSDITMLPLSVLFSLSFVPKKDNVQATSEVIEEPVDEVVSK